MGRKPASERLPEKEWLETDPEYQIIKAMCDGRRKKGLTQKMLADITGITQGDISRLENGIANPSLKTLERLASGIGLRLKIEFVPIRKPKNVDKEGLPSEE